MSWLERDMQEQGFTVAGKVLANWEITKAHEAFVRIYEGKFNGEMWPREWYYRKGVIAEGVTGHASGVWRADKFLASLTLNHNFATLVRDVMGWPSIRLAYDTLWHKPAGGSAVPFHQDDAYVGNYFGTPSATLWIPLDAITEENGGIEYAVGSHLLPAVPEIGDEFHGVRGNYRSSFTNRYPDAPAPVMLTDLRAGEATVHNGMTWHGSATNTSDGPRRALAVHYVPGNTTEMAFEGYTFESNDDGKISDKRHPILA